LLCRCLEAGFDPEPNEDQPQLPPCDDMLSMSQLEVANICASAGSEVQAVMPGTCMQRDGNAGFELRSAEWDEIVYRVCPAL